MKKFLSFIMAIAMVFSLVPLNVFAQTYDPFISYEIGNYGSFVDGDKVISDLIEYSGMNAHPRLIMTEEKFAELKSHIGDGSITAMMLERLRNEANRLVREGITTYKLSSSDHLLLTSQTVQRHVTALALAYNIFGDEIYAEHAYMELEAACYYPDWSPKHFLDTGEMCTAFAFGYDWLYNWMSDDQRNLLRTSMVEKGLNQVMDDYLDLPRERTYRWAQDDEGDNWQLVCTGGTDLVALAIGDEADARSISSQVLTYGFKRAYDFVRFGYKNLDGTYKEGLGYWDYATYYLGLQSSALISATGTDYGLADYDGVRRSADFVCYMSSNIPYSFSFGDDGDSRDTGWAVFLWLGEYLDSPEYSSVRLRKLIDPNFRYEYNMLDYMWLDETDLVYTQNNNPTDWGMVGGSNASFRTSWDVSGLIAAFHVGENDYRIHGHYDLGSFYIENNGTRFFTDLGNENYDLDNRDYSYRLKPEGHNTIVINPSKGTDQKNGINCLITNFDSGNEAYAISDLTEAYEPNGATSAIRGLKMIKDKNCIIVQDEISLNSAGEIYWFAHTRGEISVAADGRSAIVTVGSDRLWVGIMSEGGSFTAMDAIPLPTSKNVPGAADNSKYKKLAIHYTNTKNVTISVACIPLKSGETKPSWTPSVKSLSEWTGGVETSHNFVNQGNGTHKCSGCGAVENHILSAYVSNNNATCTQNGTESATCVCGYKNTRVISGSATGHKPGAAATCQAAQTCQTCGVVLSAKKSHKYSTEWSTNTNYHWHACTMCGAMKDDGAHYWNASSATTTNDKHCITCGYVAQAQLSHTHNGALVNGNTATCTENGTKSYYTCTCGKYFEDSSCTKEIININSWKVISATGHKPGPEATCQAAQTCQTCGVVLSAKKSHTYPTEWDHNDESHFLTCTSCGYKKDEKMHTWNASSATENNDKHCTICGYVAQKQLNHSHNGTYVEAVPATCTTSGHKAYYECSCGTKFTDTTYKTVVTDINLSATGHRPGAPATVTNAQVCTVCKTIIEPALGTTVSQSTLPQVTSEPGVGGFVERLYVVALGRGSDAAGKQTWINETRNGATGADVAKGFLFSEEFLNKNMSNEDFVTTLYYVFFDRTPDPSGFNTWVTLLNNGESKETVIWGFINSTEWANVCLKYGIKSGGTGVASIRVQPNEQVIGFATRLYTTCLGRDFDPKGLSDWSNALANLEMSGSEVAKGFFWSPEFINGNHSNEEYVTRLYRTFMNREPDPDGYNMWVGMLYNGTSREDVFNGFANSLEWASICAQYGILR